MSALYLANAISFNPIRSASASARLQQHQSPPETSQTAGLCAMSHTHNTQQAHVKTRQIDRQPRHREAGRRAGQLGRHLQLCMHRLPTRHIHQFQRLYGPSRQVSSNINTTIANKLMYHVYKDCQAEQTQAQKKTCRYVAVAAVHPFPNVNHYQTTKVDSSAVHSFFHMLADAVP